MIYKSAWLAPNNTSTRAWNCLLYHILLDNCFCDCFSIFAKGQWLIWMCVKGHYWYCWHEATADVLGSILFIALVIIWSVHLCVHLRMRQKPCEKENICSLGCLLAVFYTMEAEYLNYNVWLTINRPNSWATDGQGQFGCEYLPHNHRPT